MLCSVDLQLRSQLRLDRGLLIYFFCHEAKPSMFTNKGNKDHIPLHHDVH